MASKLNMLATVNTLYTLIEYPIYFTESQLESSVETAKYYRTFGVDRLKDIEVGTKKFKRKQKKRRTSIEI